MGLIFSFYSDSAEKGRPFTLACVASILARWGFDVLVADLGLEQAMLDEYFPKPRRIADSTGLLKLVEDHVAHLDPAPENYLISIDRPRAGSGRLDLLPAGIEPVEVVRARNLNWRDLYKENNLGEFLESCRAEWSRKYHFTLIDCPPGVTSISGICMAQFPDFLVPCLTRNTVATTRTLDVVHRAIAAHDALPLDRAALMIVPAVLTEFDQRPSNSTFWESTSARVGPLIANWASRNVELAAILRRPAANDTG
jgi:cellulose biosynthesis protein BcsQ